MRVSWRLMDVVHTSLAVHTRCGAPVLASPEPPADAFAFFRPTVIPSEADRQTLQHGDCVVTILDHAHGELAVFSAIRLGSHVTLDRAKGWLRHVEALRQNRFMLANGRFSHSPGVADVVGLMLDNEEVEDAENSSLRLQRRVVARRLLRDDRRHVSCLPSA